jgi:hypothetical protein
MSAEDNKHRSHLPIPTPERTGLITYDAKDPDTKFPPIEQLRPPKGAPNVLLILIDDAGFGSNSAFGGPCQTPTLEKLAAGGLKYNRFHTTALCSPTRAALLTGRSHHSVGMGGITEIATGAPGYSSVLPNTISPLARTLKLDGYSTAQFGKCHEVPVWETSPVGPFDAWPTGGGGFEYFYGFIGGEANQCHPTLYEGTTPVESKKTPEEGYHFMADMTDKEMAWVSQQKGWHPTNPSSSTSRPARPMRLTMCPRNGPTRGRCLAGIRSFPSAVDFVHPRPGAPGSVAVLINRAHTYLDLALHIDPAQERVFAAIDGNRSLDEILRIAAKAVGTEQARRFIQQLWEHDQIVFDATGPR